MRSCGCLFWEAGAKVPVGLDKLGDGIKVGLDFSKERRPRLGWLIGFRIGLVHYQVAIVVDTQGHVVLAAAFENRIGRMAGWWRWLPAVRFGQAVDFTLFLHGAKVGKQGWFVGSNRFSQISWGCAFRMGRD